MINTQSGYSVRKTVGRKKFYLNDLDEWVTKKEEAKFFKTDALATDYITTNLAQGKYELVPTLIISI